MAAAARYHRVNPQYWQVAKDWDDRARVLGIYVQTCRHRTTEGYYELPKPYIAADLGWQPNAVDRAMKNVTDTGAVLYDDHANVVLLSDALEIQSIVTANQVLGAIRRIRVVPPTPLLLAFLRLADAHSNELANAMRNDLAEVIRMVEAMGSMNGRAAHSPPHSNPRGKRQEA